MPFGQTGEPTGGGSPPVGGSQPVNVKIGGQNFSIPSGAIIAVLSAVPIIGGFAAALGSLLAAVGIQIRGKTQHIDQRQAEQVVLDMIVALTKNYQKWFGVAEVDRIHAQLKGRYIAHVQKRIFPQPLSRFNNRISDWDRQFEKKMNDEGNSFFHVNYFAAVWCARAIDAEHPEQFEEYWAPFKVILEEETFSAISKGVLVPQPDSPFLEVPGKTRTTTTTAGTAGGGLLPLSAAAAAALFFVFKK